MKNLNICIDIDGTITDAYYWLELCNDYFNTHITEAEVTDYYIHKVLGIEANAYNQFYEQHKFEIHSNPKLREDVKSSISELSLDHHIYFITARDQSLSLLTHNYLRKNDIPYDELFVLGSHYKVNKAKELNCSIFIEDNYDTAIELSKSGFKVLLMDTNYNQKPINENIERVYSWIDIYQYIINYPLQSRAM